MSYTAQDSFFILNKNGKVTKSFKAGDIVPNAVYNNPDPTKAGKVHFQPRLQQVVLTGSKKEVVDMVELYRINSNLAWVTQQYMIQHPNTGHTAESVRYCRSTAHP